MITLSMYRQLDEAILERFQPVGRVRDDKRRPKNAPEELLQLIGHDAQTEAWVRYNAQPPNWSKRERPSEFAHRLLHTKQAKPGEYPVADAPDGHHLVWAVKSDLDWSCPGPFGWHVNKTKPDLPVQYMRGSELSYSQWLKRESFKALHR
jgi:hypothetical protein